MTKPSRQQEGKITTKEIVVRMLIDRGDWMYGYELQGKHTKWGFSGVDADTRAHELSRIGYFDSPNNRYVIEHRRKGKYAQFRAVKSSQSNLNANRNDLDRNKRMVALFNQGAPAAQIFAII